MSETPGERGKPLPSDHAEIKPLDLDFSPLDQSSSATVVESSNGSSWLLPAVVVLALIAAAVIWLLPGFTATEPKESLPQASTAPNTPAAPIVDEGSPWQEAQQARYRKEAQLTLEKLLERQQELEELNVAQWAEAEFSQAAELATQGDEQYRRQKFQPAGKSYTDSLAILDELIGSIEQRVETALQAGTKALETFDVEAANSAFQHVLVLEDGNTAAKQGLARAAVARQVETEIAAAETYQQAQNLTAASQSLRAALALDQQRADVLQPQIQALEVQLRDARFTELMSSGYRSLDNGQENAALDFFAQAARLKPEASEAQQAQAQVRNKRSLSQMGRHFSRADEYERAEDWAAAVAEYESALAIDANLSDASQRKAYAQQRQKMDKALSTLNADPLRLADPAIYQKALNIRTAGQNIKPLGSKLASQLSQLSKNLSASQIERSVLIKSDGQSNVTVQRIARIGAVMEKRLQLKPGRYVAIGVRDGYRDVRREFVVPLADQVVQVDVRCVEPI